MTYDSKSLDLAAAFLSDYKDAMLPRPRKVMADELAQLIQQTIEEYLEVEIP